MKRDLTKRESRKKMWDLLGFKYWFNNYLFKHHSLNCGCAYCKSMTFMKRYRHSQERSKNTKLEKEILKEVSGKVNCGHRSYDDLHKDLEHLDGKI